MPPEPHDRTEVGVDIGGTFTDLVALDPVTGDLVTGKVLNSSLGLTAGVLAACDEVGVPPEHVRYFVHGTTLVTNLLIERTGGKVGLITTTGFRDVLEIGYSFRKGTFHFLHEQIPPLVPRHLRTEVGGRINVRGEVEEPLHESDVVAAVEALLGQEVEAVAVSLYNSYTNPEHERRVAEIVRELAPRLFVCLSVDVDPRIGEYERVSTCALNAMATPTFHRYSDDLSPRFRHRDGIRYMHSGGGLLTLEEARLRPIQLAKSGPAGGALAASAVAQHVGYEHAVTMDVGGTSTDICIMLGGEIQQREVVELEYGIPARIRSLDIHAIGAGGGSIVSFDAGAAVSIGPRSAGAVPGPACYGRGGPAAVTDANLVLGFLPDIGLLGGGVPLDREASVRALDEVARPLGTSAETLAEGVWSIVNANIAQAIREITVQQGTDVRDFVLVAFGGAGPQHAAGVAAELGIRRVVIPNHCSVLSAIGLLTADLKVFAAQTGLFPIEALGERAVQEAYEGLREQAMERLGVHAGPDVVSERFAGLRYIGQWHYVPLTLCASETPERLYERFEAQHEVLYGTRIGTPVEIVDIGVTVMQPRERDLAAYLARTDWSQAGEIAAPATRRMLLGGVRTPVGVHPRSALAVGTRLTGPCLVEEPQSVTWIPAGSHFEVTPEGYLSISVGGDGSP